MRDFELEVDRGVDIKVAEKEDSSSLFRDIPERISLATMVVAGAAGISSLPW